MTTSLWDTDFDMLDAFLDAAPEDAAARRRFLRIADDYFTWAPPDPSPTECRTLLRDLAELCDRYGASPSPPDTPGKAEGSGHNVR
jgi:hypothetical protein